MGWPKQPRVKAIFLFVARKAAAMVGRDADSQSGLAMVIFLT
jgi:hypothetical protein